MIHGVLLGRVRKDPSYGRHGESACQALRAGRDFPDTVYGRASTLRTQSMTASSVNTALNRASR